MQETKTNRKSDCTNCNIPGCKQTPFCKYCRSVKDISGARRSLTVGQHSVNCWIVHLKNHKDKKPTLKTLFFFKNTYLNKITNRYQL